MPSLRIVLTQGSIVKYPQGGGHFSVRLQYLLGLRALGHDVYWLAPLRRSGRPDLDDHRLSKFFSRLERYGFADRAAVLLHDQGDVLTLDSATIVGLSPERVAELTRTADLLWNFCCSLKTPLLNEFRHPVLIDLDPGHLQISALTTDLSLEAHRTFLTVGQNLNDPCCRVPDLGVEWTVFAPFVYLPVWKAGEDPGRGAPITSVTQWTWGGELSFEGRLLSTSKRDAYMRHLSLPESLDRPVELAANIAPDDDTGDREMLRAHDWRLVHPHEVACSPRSYQEYIRASRGELCCVKPVFRELETGWFSDRSAAYLASGRPVIFEDTGLTDLYPGESGLLLFGDTDEAIDKIRRVDRDYEQHSKAARELAADSFSAEKMLPRMLEACGA